jgi:hypothetical protein
MPTASSAEGIVGGIYQVNKGVEVTGMIRFERRRGTGKSRGGGWWKEGKLGSHCLI